MTVSEMSARMTEHGLRPTPQRLAVYDYLLRHRTHPTAEEIFAAVREQNPSVSMTTVYNVLRALSEAGLCRTLTIDAEERHFDAGMEDHAHLRCRVCGHIWDASLGRVECGCEAVAPGFREEQRELYLFGVCAACSAKEEDAQNPSA